MRGPPTTRLLDITHVTLPGNRQQLALTMSGPAEAPESFTIDDPARIALDLPDTANELDDKRIAVSAGLLQNVTTVEAGGRTRVVINLASLTPYSTAVRGNQLLVTLDGEGGLRGARRGHRRCVRQRRPGRARRAGARRAHRVAGLPTRPDGRGADHLQAVLAGRRRRHALGGRAHRRRLPRHRAGRQAPEAARRHGLRDARAVHRRDLQQPRHQGSSSSPPPRSTSSSPTRATRCSPSSSSR